MKKGRLHELFLGQGETLCNKNVEHMPSVYDIAILGATIDFGQIQTINLAKLCMKDSRDVSTSRVPLLDLAQLHAAYCSLQVEHTVIAAVIGKVLKSYLGTIRFQGVHQEN